MTTIAYRDKIMAADTMGTWSGDVSYGVMKLAKTRHYLLGFTGVFAYARPLYDWIETMDEKEVPPEEFYRHTASLFDMDKTCTALMVDWDGNIRYICSDGVGARLQRKYEVMGSGGRFAMGAMYHGASAREGIEAAIEFDDATGGKVNTIDWHSPNRPPF